MNRFQSRHATKGAMLNRLQQRNAEACRVAKAAAMMANAPITLPPYFPDMLDVVDSHPGVDDDDSDDADVSDLDEPTGDLVPTADPPGGSD